MIYRAAELNEQEFQSDDLFLTFPATNTVFRGLIVSTMKNQIPSIPIY